MALPVFSSVVYLSPWLPLPPSGGKPGIDVLVQGPGGAGQVLAGRLRQGGTTITTVVATISIEVVIVPAAPLSAMLDYYVDIQWVAADTPPAQVTWNQGSYVTSPIVTATLTLGDAAITGASVKLGWDFGGAAIIPAGANILAFNTGGSSAGFSRGQGTSGTMPLNNNATPGTQLYLQGVMPIAPGAGFTAPFSNGPIVSGAPLPLTPPTVNSAKYDGSTLLVGWTAPAAPATGGTIGYDLLALTGGTTTAAGVFAASAGGGMAVLGAASTTAPTSVAGRIRIGAVLGDGGTPVPLITAPPILDQIAVASVGGTVAARVTFPASAPTDATATVTLTRAGATLGTATATKSGATVSITGLTSATDGWAVQGSMSATIAGAAVTGPTCAPQGVINTAPVIRDIAMTADPSRSGGWIVTISTAAPPPAGLNMIATLTQGGTTIATQPIAVSAVLSFALTQGSAGANMIDGSQVASASIVFASARSTGPAAQANFIGAAPTITGVQNVGASDPSGLPQSLQVYAATGGAVGQLLALQLLAGNTVVMTGTGTTNTYGLLPLTQPLDPARDWLVRARWTGGGVTAATFGGWSTPVAVLTATTAITSADYDNGKLTLAMQPPQGGVAAAQGGYLFAAKIGGGAIHGAPVIGIQGSFDFTPGSDSWQVGAQPFQPLPASANSRTLAPSSALLPLLVTAPTLATLAYDGATLSASWNLVSDGTGNPATASMIKVANGTGTTVVQPAGSTSGEVAILIPASAQGQATLSVRAVRNAAGASFSGGYASAVAPLVAAPTIGSIALSADGKVVSAVLTPPASVPSGTSYQAWLMADDHVVAGPVTATVNAGVTSVSFAYAAGGVAGLAIVAQAQATVSGVALSGPRSAPAPVLASAPAFARVTIAPSKTAGQWQLDATWLPPPDGSAVVTYTLRLTDSSGGEVFSSAYGGATSGSHSFAQNSVHTNLAYLLTVKATTANGSTSPLGGATFWFSTPTLTAVTVGDGQVNAQWTAPVGPVNPLYRLNLTDTIAGTVLATTVTAATSAGLDIDALGLRASGSYAVDLAAQLGPVLFAPGPSGGAALLLVQPTNLAILTSAASGKATLNWTAIADANGYTVAFSDGTAPATVTSASYPFTAPLAAGHDLSVTVTANIVTGGVTRTGPASLPLAVPTTAPALQFADYDGTNVSGRWQAVAEATAYVVTVLNGSGAIAATAPPTGSTATRFAATLDPSGQPYAIVVQAVSKAGTGLPSNPLPVFRTAWFVSTAQPSTQAPSIFPAATLARAAAPISIYLPLLAPTAIIVGPIGAFNLTANTDSGSKAAFPQILSFAANSEAWIFPSTPAIRLQLQNDYVAFLQAAETKLASAWGIATLQAAIARWMPQTFAESHYYAYGLSLASKGTGSIDLRPGLVLRVGFANYTNVWSGDANSWLNGFGGGSPTDFDVADSMSGANGWQLSMDSFVARLTASGAMTVAPPITTTAASTAAGVADAADLFFPGFPNPFYRLFFPGDLQNPSSTGSIATGANFALASAASFTALGAATPAPGSNTPVVYFRGRAVLRVMIRVRVNDMEVVVPLGTTVGNILDRYGVRPPATSVQLTGVMLERATGPGIAVFGANPQPPTAVYASDQRQLVRLDWSTMATYGGPADATTLPLLHGDRIAF
jgi:hypothetical protein